MIYVRKHAIKRYRQRINKDIDDESTVKDKILETVLFYYKKKEDKNRNQIAYIKGNVVAITKLHSNKRDESVITILPTKFNKCWWNKK